MTPKEFAQCLGISVSSVYRRIKKGIISAIKIGRRWKIQEPDPCSETTATEKLEPETVKKEPEPEPKPEPKAKPKPKPEPKQEKKPMPKKTKMERDTGFYGKGTPQIAFYGPIGKGYCASSSPYTKRNYKPAHHKYEIPEGTEYEWCLALQLHPMFEFEVILCDYKGDAVYETDDINDAPEDCRARLKAYRGFSQTKSRAIFSTARKVTVTPGTAQQIN